MRQVLLNMLADFDLTYGSVRLCLHIAYPLAMLVVPAAWWFFGRPRGCLIDVLGNAADLYDSVSWWDDANHFVNWAILVAAFGQLRVRLPVGWRPLHSRSVSAR